MGRKLVLRKTLRALIVLLISVPLILLLLAIEDEPSVAGESALDAGELARVENILLEASPQTPSTRSRHSVYLSPEEIQLLLRYGTELLDLAPDWAAGVNLEQDRLTGDLSIEILGSPLPLFVNLQGGFSAESDRLALQSLRVGRLAVPGPLLDYVLRRIQDNVSTSDSDYRDIRSLLASIERVAIDERGMQLEFMWDPALASRLGQQAQRLFVSSADQQRMLHYYEQISLVALALPADHGAVSLNAFLVPLFRSALERSEAGADPVAENRTLLQTLAIYLHDASLAPLIEPELAAQLTTAKLVEVRLHRRRDLAQHLISSAAISASAGAGLAELISNTKEAYDARYRSGFSFSDLAANTVGVKLASLATADAEAALVMQQRLATLDDEADYMPEIGNNRDGISEADFNRLYQDRSSEEYQARLAEIQLLIDARPLFRNLP